MNNKNYLMLCELHHPNIHGKDEFSDPHIETHYLVYDRFEPWSGISYLSSTEEYTDNEYESDDDLDYDDDNPNHIEKINECINFLRGIYLHNQTVLNHPIIQNYHNIISRSNYIKPEIGQYITLPTREAIAILKTFWLRIVQRKWKKIFAERQQIIRQRHHPASLQYRQIHGKWPPNCNYLPGLEGMLSNL